MGEYILHQETQGSVSVSIIKGCHLFGEEGRVGEETLHCIWLIQEGEIINIRLHALPNIAFNGTVGTREVGMEAESVGEGSGAKGKALFVTVSQV